MTVVFSSCLFDCQSIVSKYRLTSGSSLTASATSDLAGIGRLSQSSPSSLGSEPANLIDSAALHLMAQFVIRFQSLKNGVYYYDWLLLCAKIATYCKIMLAMDDDESKFFATFFEIALCCCTEIC